MSIPWHLLVHAGTAELICRSCNFKVPFARLILSSTHQSYRLPALCQKLVDTTVEDDSEGLSSMIGKRSATTLIAVLTATSVAVLLATELELCLALFCWAAANLLGLPFSVFVAGEAISALLAAYVAVLLFVRIYRIERQIARGEDYEDVSWRLFSPS